MLRWLRIDWSGPWTFGPWFCHAWLFAGRQFRCAPRCLP